MKMIEVNTIEEYENLMPRASAERSWFFRGEDNRYDFRLPAIWRLQSDFERQAQHVRTSGISRLFIEREIVPRTKEYYGIPLNNDQWFGEYDLCNWHDGIPSFRQIYWQVVALLQHYGYRTAFLDISFDPRVALFFCCYSASRQSIEHTGYGYVYQWSIADVCKHLYSKVLLTSLTKLSAFFRNENISHTSRPEVQVAGSLRVGIGVEPWDYVKEVFSALNDISTVYVIDRSKLPAEFFDPKLFFPKDILHTRILNAANDWSQEAREALTDARSTGAHEVTAILEHALRDINEGCPTS